MSDVRALIIPNKELTQYTFTIQVKGDNGDWREIDKVYRHPEQDKLYSSVEELKEDLANGEDQTESDK